MGSLPPQRRQAGGPGGGPGGRTPRNITPREGAEEAHELLRRNALVGRAALLPGISSGT